MTTKQRESLAITDLYVTRNTELLDRNQISSVHFVAVTKSGEVTTISNTKDLSAESPAYKTMPNLPDSLADRPVQGSGENTDLEVGRRTSDTGESTDVRGENTDVCEFEV